MKIRVAQILVVMTAIYAMLSFVYASELSDADVRQEIIKRSIASYPGNCPCPYNHARDGSRCGKRSAWSRPGGYSPLCYPAEVSDAQVDVYRENRQYE